MNLLVPPSSLVPPSPSPSPGSRDLGPASGLITPVALVQKWPTGVPLCQGRLGGLPNVL